MWIDIPESKITSSWYLSPVRYIVTFFFVSSNVSGSLLGPQTGSSENLHLVLFSSTSSLRIWSIFCLISGLFNTFSTLFLHNSTMKGFAPSGMSSGKAAQHLFKLWRSPLQASQVRTCLLGVLRVLFMVLSVPALFPLRFGVRGDGNGLILLF